VRRALAVLVLAVVAAVGWSASGAAAATVVQVGWWDRNADALLPALDPPPEGALRVANDPAGTSAVAAVRASLADGELDPTLTLRVAGDAVPAGAAFVACPATSEWEPAEGAPLAEAPTADCEIGAALGAVADDGTAVAFDLSTLPDAPVVDVVILPAPTGESPVADTFVVDFEAPTDSDVVTRTAGSSGGAAAPGPAPAPSGTPSSSDGSSFGTGGSTPSFTPPAGGTVTVPGGAAVTPAPTAPTSGVGATSGGAPLGDSEEAAAPPAGASSGSGNRWIGLATIAAILALGAHLWRADRVRAAMTAGPVVGGLGRFVRERHEPAPEVS